jgi:hypothetical protein
MDRAELIAGDQLAKAGSRLAEPFKVAFPHLFEFLSGENFQQAQPLTPAMPKPAAATRVFRLKDILCSPPRIEIPTRPGFTARF